MSAYNPNTKHTCSGFMDTKENGSGFQYFVEKSGEETKLIISAEHIRLPGMMRILNENNLTWVKAGNVNPKTTSLENIVLLPELDIDQSILVGVSISTEIKETDKRKYIRRITSTRHKRKLYVSDELCQIIKKAMSENDELELFATTDKRAGFYLIGSNERIYAYIQEYQDPQLNLMNKLDPEEEKSDE